jgi:hypothetical protein
LGYPEFDRGDLSRTGQVRLSFQARPVSASKSGRAPSPRQGTPQFPGQARLSSQVRARPSSKSGRAPAPRQGTPQFPSQARLSYQGRARPSSKAGPVSAQHPRHGPPQLPRQGTPQFPGQPQLPRHGPGQGRLSSQGKVRLRFRCSVGFSFQCVACLSFQREARLSSSARPAPFPGAVASVSTVRPSPPGKRVTGDRTDGRTSHVCRREGVAGPAAGRCRSCLAGLLLACPTSP